MVGAARNCCLLFVSPQLLRQTIEPIRPICAPQRSGSPTCALDFSRESPTILLPRTDRVRHEHMGGKDEETRSGYLGRQAAATI
jgi:hypothetical protein